MFDEPSLDYTGDYHQLTSGIPMSVCTYALITTESSIQHGNFRNNWTRYIHALAKQNAKCNKKFHIAKFRPNY